MIVPLKLPVSFADELHIVREYPTILQFLLRIVIVLSEEQFLNASLPIVETLAGRSTEASLEQEMNALIPISVTVSEILTDVRFAQAKKA